MDSIDYKCNARLCRSPEKLVLGLKGLVIRKTTGSPVNNYIMDSFHVLSGNVISSGVGLNAMEELQNLQLE